MKKIIGALVGVASLGLLPVAPAQAAEACVTRSEYRAVESGWTMHHVQAKFDSNGKNMYQGYGYQGREWKACNGDIVYVGFRWKSDHWAVDSKSWYDPSAGGTD